MSDQGGKGEKLVLIGDSGVGKTCIITRLTKNSFNANEISTTGGSFATKTIELPTGETLDLNIWDTAGQERYKALTKIFFQGAKLAILVYDITRRDSYDHMKTEWLNVLKEHGDPDVIKAIAGNKSDLYDEEAVPEQEAREFAKSIGAIFALTSAQNNSGIKELFQTLAKKFLHPEYDIYSTTEQNPNQEQNNSTQKPEQVAKPNAEPKKDKKQKQEKKEESGGNIKIGVNDVKIKKKSCC